MELLTLPTPGVQNSVDRFHEKGREPCSVARGHRQTPKRYRCPLPVARRRQDSGVDRTCSAWQNKLISLKVPRKTLKATTLDTGEPASAWMRQHSPRDAVTGRFCKGLSTDEDGAGLNDDDDPSPEEVDATVGEAIEDELPRGPIVRVP